jgi:chromosome segregation ATPase
LEEKIVVLQKEREVHVEKVLILQEELRKAQGLLASKDDEIDSLRVAAENFESLKSNYDALKQATQHQQTLHNEEVVQLQLQLQAADEKASLLDVELNKAKEMLVDTQEMCRKENAMAIHVKEIEITALSEEIQALQDRLRTQEVSLMQHASQELQAKSQELEQLHLQFQAIQQELQAVRQEADARAQQKHVLDTAYGESQMKLGVFEQENLRISKALTEAQDALGSLQDTYDALTSGELPALHNANATLTEEITYLQQEQRRWVQENEHFRTRMSTLEQQAQAAQREAQQAQHKLQQASSWEARAMQAEDQLKKLETKKKKDLEMLKKQNEKISLLQQELHQLKEQQPSTKPVVVSASESAGTGHSFSEADWKTREEEFHQSQEVLQEEIANLKQEYLAKMDQYQSLERQLAQVEEENVQLHGELEARKQELQFLSEDVAEWKAKAAALIQEQNTSEEIRLGQQQQQQQQQQQAQDQSATTLRMLQAQMHELQFAAKTAEEQHQQVLQDVQQRTQSTIADLHQQLSHWKRENMRLGEDVHRLEQQLSAVQSQKADESMPLPSLTGNIFSEDDLARDMETGYVSTADSGNSLTSSGSRAKMSGHQNNSAFHANQLNRMEAKTLVDMQHGTTLLVLADDKKDLAGLHPWLVQCWATLRQRCAAYPWALKILGDRPPRLSASAQVALMYLLFLQFYVIYLRSFGCVREATGVAESVA